MLFTATDLIIPLTLISSLLHKPHNVALNAACLISCRFICAACDATTTAAAFHQTIYEARDNEKEAKLLTEDNDDVWRYGEAVAKSSRRPVTRIVKGWMKEETIYLKILLHICIGKMFYFYQVSE